MSQFTPEQQAAVIRIFKAFEVYLPAGPLAARISLIEAHMDKTYFAWIGGFELGDPYYYRLHSPVAYCEFDFHCGSELVVWRVSERDVDYYFCRSAVFLTNTSPAKCHIHTITRLPNAGDYGKALLKQWRTRNCA